MCRVVPLVLVRARAPGAAARLGPPGEGPGRSARDTRETRVTCQPGRALVPTSGFVRIVYIEEEVWVRERLMIMYPVMTDVLAVARLHLASFSYLIMFADDVTAVISNDTAVRPFSDS